MRISTQQIRRVLKQFSIYRIRTCTPILRGEVSRPICISQVSSDASGTVCILRPSRSRLLALWWLALHLLLLAAIVGLGVPPWVKVALAAALGAHAVVRRPQSATPVLVCRADGHWVLPERGPGPLRLARGTSCTAHWARIVLVGKTQTSDILLLRDQLDEVSWRILQGRLRGSFIAEGPIELAPQAPAKDLR